MNVLLVPRHNPRGIHYGDMYKVYTRNAAIACVRQTQARNFKYHGTPAGWTRYSDDECIQFFIASCDAQWIEFVLAGHVHVEEETPTYHDASYGP